MVFYSSICMLNEWKINGSCRLFEKFRNVGVICVDLVFWESFLKMGIVFFDVK